MAHVGGDAIVCVHKFESVSTPAVSGLQSIGAWTVAVTVSASVAASSAPFGGVSARVTAGSAVTEAVTRVSVSVPQAVLEAPRAQTSDSGEYPIVVVGCVP